MPAYITALLARGERAQAEVLLPGYHELLRGFRQPIHQVRRALVDALFCTLDGRFEDAEHLGEEALTIVQRAGWGPGPFLCLTHKLAVGEVAQVLGVAEGTVKTLLFRARTGLRAMMEET